MSLVVSYRYLFIILFTGLRNATLFEFVIRLFVLYIGIMYNKTDLRKCYTGYGNVARAMV